MMLFQRNASKYWVRRQIYAASPECLFGGLVFENTRKDRVDVFGVIAHVELIVNLFDG